MHHCTIGTLEMSATSAQETRNGIKKVAVKATRKSIETRKDFQDETRKEARKNTGKEIYRNADEESGRFGLGKTRKDSDRPG